MAIYESIFLRLDFFEDKGFIEATWYPTTENFTEREYKEEFLNYLHLALEFKPKRAMINTQDFLFTTSPTLQEWTSETISAPIIEMGLKQMAFVVSKEFIAQLAIEQLMEEPSAQKFTTKYFDSKEEAKEWILSFADSETM